MNVNPEVWEIQSPVPPPLVTLRTQGGQTSWLASKGGRAENWLDGSVPVCVEDLHPLTWVLHERLEVSRRGTYGKGPVCTSAAPTVFVVLGSLRFRWKRSWSLEDFLTTSCYCLCLVLFLSLFGNSF